MSGLVVRPGGTGTAQDAGLVRAELENIPVSLTDRMVAAGVEVVACRNSVVEVEPGLTGKVPRQWCQHPDLACPTNDRCRHDPRTCPTWDDVPGVFQPANNRVVVATIAEQVPPLGTKHGSISLAVHEVLHGADYVGGKPSQSRRFRDAWDADLTLLGLPYFTSGAAGREESYAESAAREFGRDRSLSGRWPALTAYWAQPDLAAQDTDDGAAVEAVGEFADIGYGVVGPDHATLFLRAEGENGECGHGAISVPLTDLPMRMRMRLALEALKERDSPATFPVPANFDWGKTS